MAPTQLSRKFLSSTQGMPISPARHSTRKVLPVPMRPVRRYPIGIAIVRPRLRSTASSRSQALASTWPATSSSVRVDSRNSRRPAASFSMNSFFILVRYAPADPNDSTKTVAQVFFSTPNLIFGGLSQTTQGIAINPVTNTAALADANATGLNGPQINLINNLDQSVSSISFFATCSFYATKLPCANSAELLGTAGITWQPYSNAIVSYNPGLNQVSISDPVSRRRYAFVCNLPSSSSCIVNPQDAGEKADV